MIRIWPIHAHIGKVTTSDFTREVARTERMINEDSERHEVKVMELREYIKKQTEMVRTREEKKTS